MSTPITFDSNDEPFQIKGRGWVYPVIYRGERLENKTAYVQQLMRDGCALNGKHIVPIGVESFAILGLSSGMGLGLLLKERIAG